MEACGAPGAGSLCPGVHYVCSGNCLMDVLCGCNICGSLLFLHSRRSAGTACASIVLSSLFHSSVVIGALCTVAAVIGGYREGRDPADGSIV